MPHASPGAQSDQSEFGELGWIRLIRERAARQRLGRGHELRLGIGDDCAILRPRRGEEIVVTTDFSLEGRHFRRDWHPPQSAGHRTLARGLSDLAAMGARPVAAFLSLALPRAVAAERSWVEGFLDGLLGLAERVGVPLAGGDTAEAPGTAILADIMLLGAVPAGRALRRDGARPGDRIFCSGGLGGAAAELAWLAEGHAVRMRPAALDEWRRAAMAGDHPQLFPEPRLALGQAMVRRGLATAAIDLSDGLSTDLRHLCEASGVAADIEAARLPVHRLAAAAGQAAARQNPAGQKAGEISLGLALNGGEDYELLFTVNAKAQVPRRLGSVALTEIGRVTKPRRGQPPVTLIAADGLRRELPPGGWEHLR